MGLTPPLTLLEQTLSRPCPAEDPVHGHRVSFRAPFHRSNRTFQQPPTNRLRRSPPGLPARSKEATWHHCTTKRCSNPTHVHRVRRFYSRIVHSWQHRFLHGRSCFSLDLGTGRHDPRAARITGSVARGSATRWRRVSSWGAYYRRPFSRGPGPGRASQRARIVRRQSPGVTDVGS